MLLILCELNDNLVNFVVDLLPQSVKYVIIDDESSVFVEKIRISKKFNELKIRLKVNDETINLEKITSYWYRRGNLMLKVPNYNYLEVDNEIVRRYIEEDAKVIKHFVLQYLETLPKIGSFYYENPTRNNKLFNLLLASKIGLNIPQNTYVLRDLKPMKRMLQNDSSLFITKAISEVSVSIKDTIISAGTKKVNSDDLNTMDINSFGYSLIQSNVKKRYELRTTYFKGKIFTVLLNSQEHENTIDSRTYKVPYRVSGVELPIPLMSKILELMDNLDFDFCSIDFIVDVHDNIVFLEINPNGQVGKYNYYGEWGLYKEIVNYLIRLQ